MNEMQRLMGEEIERLQTRMEELKAELAKRPIVYIAKLPSGHMFMTHKAPQVFLSIENAKKWFSTVPVYDVEFEPYTGEQE
jgi:hypothetical protein